MLSESFAVCSSDKISPSTIFNSCQVLILCLLFMITCFKLSVLDFVLLSRLVSSWPLYMFLYKLLPSPRLLYTFHFPSIEPLSFYPPSKLWLLFFAMNLFCIPRSIVRLNCYSFSFIRIMFIENMFLKTELDASIFTHTFVASEIARQSLYLKSCLRLRNCPNQHFVF